MHRYEFADEQWAQIADYFPANGKRGGQWKDHRRAVNGILWVLWMVNLAAIVLYLRQLS